MKLPRYKNSDRQQRGVKHCMATSAFIRAFWNASSEIDKRDGAFLSFLTLCGWCNVVGGRRADEATRKWRNRELADYLDVEHDWTPWVRSAF
jgi:hypothetical protein